MFGLKSSVSRGGLFALALGVMHCGGPLTYNPRPTARAPEADTHLVVQPNNAQANSQVQVRMEHLAPPDRIQEGGTHYVAWSRSSPQAQWLRVGALNYNPSARTGELNTIAQDTAFEFQVTVESMPNPGSPSANVVVTERVNMPQAQKPGGPTLTITIVR